jgi:S1-C subfamily serine protease
MTADVFLTTTDLRDLDPASSGGQVPLDHQQALMLLSAKRQDLADLFAEPVFTRDDDGELVSASWYISTDREARRLGQLQPARRARVEDALKDKLRDLAQAQSDPELTDLIAAMSVVRSEQCLFAVGTSPVIVDWGLKPKGDTALTGSGLAIGALAAYLTTSDTADDSISLGEAARSDGAGDDEDVAAGAELASEGSVEATASGSAAGTTTAVLIDDEPFYRKRWFRYLIYGALILLVLWLLCLLFRPYIDAWLNPPPSAADLHAPVLRGLEAERDRLKTLAQDPCSPEALRTARRGPAVGSITPGVPTENVPRRPGGAGAIGPDASVPDPSTPTEQQPQENVPTTPDNPDSQRDNAQPSDAAPGTEPLPLSELARRLESSIVFILAVGNNQTGLGSGFFISKDTVMTNSHVVEGAREVFVTSKHLGLVRKARVIAQTSRPRPGKRDYAILKLAKPVNSVAPLALSNQLQKLDRVVAVGYPAALSALDSQQRAFIKGDPTASPEAIFTHGLVNVIFRDNRPNVIAHSADISQGNSGGPLVDECKRVVGINTFISQEPKSGRRSKFSLVASDMMAFLKENNVPFSAADGRCEAQTAQSTPQTRGAAPPASQSAPPAGQAAPTANQGVPPRAPGSNPAVK